MLSKAELLEEVKLFYEQYLYIKDIHNVYLDIFDAFEKQDKAKDFLGVAACACIDSYLLTTARMFDTHGNASTIFKLIKICRNNITLFTNQQQVGSALDEFEQDIQKEPFKNLLDVIRHRRNKYLAHNDPQYFPHTKLTDKAVQDNKSFALHEFWALVNAIGELLTVLHDNLTIDAINLRCQYNRDLKELFADGIVTTMHPLR